MYNQGDTITFILDYTVNDASLVSYNPDEIEFCIGDKTYTKTDGDIAIDSDSGKYAVNIGQADSFDFDRTTKYQIRIKKGSVVVSSSIERMIIGDSISRTVL